MQCRYIVIHTGSSQHGGTVGSLADDNIDRGQVGVRRAEPVTMCNCHGQDLGDTAGKRDSTTICGMERRADVGFDIDTPLPPVSADWSKDLHDIPGERGCQSRAGIDGNESCDQERKG